MATHSRALKQVTGSGLHDLFGVNGAADKIFHSENGAPCTGRVYQLRESSVYGCARLACSPLLCYKHITSTCTDSPNSYIQKSNTQIWNFKEVWCMVRGFTSKQQSRTTQGFTSEMLCEVGGFPPVLSSEGH